MAGALLPSQKLPLTEEPVSIRMLVLMRLVLAAAVLVVVLIDPPVSGVRPALLYASLFVYFCYGALVLMMAAGNGWRPLPRWTHWTDVFAMAGLLMLSDGVNSILFNLFLFAVLVASFSYGLQEGLRVLAASVLAFIAVAALLGLPDDVELNRVIIRLVLLLVLGYLLAHWGGQEQTLRRRLALLNEINAGWDPHAGSDQLIGANLSRLRHFYRAGSCLLVVRRSAAARPFLYTARTGKEWQAAIPVELVSAAEPIMLGMAPQHALAYRSHPGLTWTSLVLDIRNGQRAHEDDAACAALAELLEARCFISVPYDQRDGVAGRLFIVEPEGAVARPDLLFAIQAARAIAAVVENVSLTENLVATAGEQERMRISRDLHDTTIQPYIALKLALDALRLEAGPDAPYARRLSEIVEMTEATVHDLRSYASGLKSGAALHAEALAAGINGQGERLRKFYGLTVDMSLDIPGQIGDRLATETYQIVAEGLSNVLRHTKARRAFVRLSAHEEQLVLRIGNESGDGLYREFQPRSISERARMLGGSADVSFDEGGYAVVSVYLPMSHSL